MTPKEVLIVARKRLRIIRKERLTRDGAGSIEPELPRLSWPILPGVLSRICLLLLFPRPLSAHGCCPSPFRAKSLALGRQVLVPLSGLLVIFIVCHDVDGFLALYRAEWRMGEILHVACA